MAFCGQCGFENPEGAKFCGSCGADLTQQEVGNVESMVNEHEGACPPPSPVDYVPIDTPSAPPEATEAPITAEVPKTTEAPTAAAPPIAPAPSVAPAPPVEPAPSVEPVPPAVPAPPTPEPPTVPEPPVEPTAPPTPPPSAENPPTPQPPTGGNAGKGGGKGKTCLGIGCGIGLVVLLAIGGLGWWGYSYLQKNGMKWEELLNGSGFTTSTPSNDENGTTGNFSEDVDEGDVDEEETAEGMNKNEGAKTIEGVEQEAEADKREATEKEEKAKAEEAKRIATGNQEKAKQLAKELGVPVVSYNVLPKHDMYYLDKDSEIGLQCKISQQSGRATKGTVEVTHWFTGRKFKYNLQSCGNSIYRLTNSESGSGSTYLFVYEGGKRMLYGEKGNMKEVNMK